MMRMADAESDHGAERISTSVLASEARQLRAAAERVAGMMSELFDASIRRLLRTLAGIVVAAVVAGMVFAWVLMGRVTGILDGVEIQGLVNDRDTVEHRIASKLQHHDQCVDFREVAKTVAPRFAADLDRIVHCDHHSAGVERLRRKLLTIEAQIREKAE